MEVCFTKPFIFRMQLDDVDSYLPSMSVRLSLEIGRGDRTVKMNSVVWIEWEVFRTFKTALRSRTISDLGLKDMNGNDIIVLSQGPKTSRVSTRFQMQNIGNDETVHLHGEWTTDLETVQMIRDKFLDTPDLW